MSKKIILSFLVLVMGFGMVTFAGSEQAEAASYTSSVYGGAYYWDRPYGGYPYTSYGWAPFGGGWWGTFGGGYGWGWSEGPATIRHFDSRSGTVTNACYGYGVGRRCF